LQHGTVMIAEESATVRHIITAALRPYGITVVAVGSGAEALAKCRVTAPDVVVLDVDAPRAEEFATLDAVRLMAGLERVPVLFLTSRTTVPDVVRGLERGVHDYIRKPVDPGDVLSRVTAALRTKRLEDTLGRAAVPRPAAPVAAPAPSTGMPRLPSGPVVGECAVVLVDVDQLAATTERYGRRAAEELLGVVGPPAGLATPGQ
jgi:DNA-binding response OmpR family regulator